MKLGQIIDFYNKQLSSFSFDQREETPNSKTDELNSN